jgi:hypothetical protein
VKGRNHLEKSVDGRHILKCVVDEYDVRMWTGFIRPAGSCEDGNEASRGFLDQLKHYRCLAILCSMELVVHVCDVK